jgi:aspartate/glutamate racemase
MKPIIGIVHATRNSLEPVNQVFAARLGQDATILNFLDEAMLAVTQADGALAPDVVRRMQNILVSAQEAGAAIIVASCTSLAPAIEAAREQVHVPVVRVDVPLAVEAVSRFQRVAVVVTAATAIVPFRELLEATASTCGKTIETSFRLCPGAFSALSDGDSGLHDTIVLDTITVLAAQGAEAILLPQPSTARVTRKVPRDLGIAVLSSLDATVNHVAATFIR